MSRRIVNKRYQSVDNQVRLDAWTDKLIKYIPSEIIAAWLTIDNIIQGLSYSEMIIVRWILFILFIIITAFWINKTTYEPGMSPAYGQIAISIGSFIVWVIAMGGPFESLNFYNTIYSSIILILYTLVIPIIE